MEDSASLEAFLYYRHDRQPEAAPRPRRRHIARTRPAVMLRHLRKIARRAVAQVGIVS